jgi:hypothetical protein
MLMKTSLRELYGNSKEAHRRRNEAVCKAFREIKLDTTNTLWTTLLTEVF